MTLRGREQRLARLAEAKRHRVAREQERQDAYEARLSERARKDPRGRLLKRPVADPEARVNRTDPDSRVVRDYWGHYQGYNVQAAATREQIVVAAELTRQATDVHELRPMVEAANDNLRALGQAPIGVLLAAAGPAPRGRIPAALSARERMRRKLTTKRGRRLYEQRRWMIEPVFGEIKENRGIRRFQRRGFEACASEWKLIATTHNLRKLYRYRGRQSSPGPWGRPPPESRRARCRSERSRPPSVRALARGRRARPSNGRTSRQ